ncbi:hypothetical protein B0A52_03235 [Exophiala mesophila]|uniref:Antifungal protein n=1 Tax=Exophiala mesophila TaxID=212818 RepID=A0A438NAT5_EXOME|nr:hypothetical protein B0A52_03235 [Exophiala mesophila]
MKLLASSSPILLMVLLMLLVARIPTTTATAVGLPDDISHSGNPFDLGGRDIKTMNGKCTKSGQCRVPGGIKKKGYSCRNSECRPEDVGQDCKLARDEKGTFVGKCPFNLLDYDWEWPPVDPKKDKKDD